MQPNTYTDWQSATDEEILNTDLIIALGLESMSDEEKQEFLAQTTNTVQKATASRVLDQLTHTQKQEFSRLIDQEDASLINQFLLLNVPNFAELLREETITFKRAMLTGMIPG